MDDLVLRQNRQLKARLESIATAGEILRVSLGTDSLPAAVRTLLMGLNEVIPCRAAALFEVGPEGLAEISRLIDGEEMATGPGIPLADLDNPGVDCVLRNRHLILDDVPSLLPGGVPGPAVLIPFEGRLGPLAPDEASDILRASHLLWIEGPESVRPSPEALDTLTALASQAGVLLTGFRFRDDLARTYKALHEANQRLQRDIDRARRIQEGLLPQELPNIPGLSVASRYQPAEKVSGDYFDCFPIDPEHQDGMHVLVIADVSGHGISAAMVMAMFKVILRREARPGRPPSEVLGRINRLLLDQIRGIHFVTVFLAYYDPRTRRMLWCSAGHCPQVVVRADGTTQELLSDGVFVGVFDDLQAVDQTMDLGEGDTLLLYTDGITEADGPSGEMFELERLVSTTCDNRQMAPGPLLDLVLQKLDAFTEGAARQDDVTLFAARA